MCIIACKPVGTQFPDEATIDNMWNNNPDGAGMMWAEGGHVHIRKGFMTLGDFKNFLTEFAKTHDTTATPCVLHFRIQTHGGVNPECTHPFPVKESESALKRLEFDTDVGVAHNGIIPITPRKGLSDTMEYISSQLAYMKRINKRFYAKKLWRRLIESAIESKMAFLDSKGKIYTIGNFITARGMVYSNTSYLPPIKKTTVYGDYSRFGYYDRNGEWHFYSTKTESGSTQSKTHSVVGELPSGATDANKDKARDISHPTLTTYETADDVPEMEVDEETGETFVLDDFMPLNSKKYMLYDLSSGYMETPCDDVFIYKDGRVFVDDPDYKDAVTEYFEAEVWDVDTDDCVVFDEAKSVKRWVRYEEL